MADLPLFRRKGRRARSSVWRIRLGQPAWNWSLRTSRKFREQLEQWLILVKTMWPECPARVSSTGGALIVSKANAITSMKTLNSQAKTLF
jgi:hypothetical protein